MTLLIIFLHSVHAVIEEYLLNGEYGEDIFNTVFAVGCPQRLRQADDGSDIQAMRTVFCRQGRPFEQIAGWTQVKQRYIDEVCLPIHRTCRRPLTWPASTFFQWLVCASNGAR